MDYRVMFGPSALGMAKRVERIDDAARIPEYVARALPRHWPGAPALWCWCHPDMLTQRWTPASCPSLTAGLPGEIMHEPAQKNIRLCYQSEATAGDRWRRWLDTGRSLRRCNASPDAWCRRWATHFAPGHL